MVFSKQRLMGAAICAVFGMMVGRQSSADSAPKSSRVATPPQEQPATVVRPVSAQTSARVETAQLSRHTVPVVSQPVTNSEIVTLTRRGTSDDAIIDRIE